MHRRTALRMIFVLGLMAAHAAAYAQSSAAAATAAAAGPAAPAEPAWVVRSNQYTQELLDVQLKHSPEQGSAQGVAKYDPLITDATRADEIAQRKELEAVLARLKKVEAKEKDKNVREDLEIIAEGVQPAVSPGRLSAGAQGAVPRCEPGGVCSGCGYCWTTRWRRSGGRRRWCGCEVCRSRAGFQAVYRGAEAARDGADGEAGRGLSVDRRDGDGAGAGQELYRTGSRRCFASTS